MGHTAARRICPEYPTLARRIARLVVCASILLPWTPATAALPCDSQPRAAAMPVEIAVPPGRWLLAHLTEDGTDWVLVAKRQRWQLETDTAPSRMATEQLTLPGSWFPRLTLDARAWNGDPLQKPALNYRCLPWEPPLMASVDLMWGGAWLVQRERAGGDAAAARLDQQARFHFARALGASPAAALKATAQHSTAYLLTRIGHRPAAAAVFDEAARQWQIAGQRGAHLAARFHAAQARLNGGNVAEASMALDALRKVPDLHRWPFLQRWVENDYCVALHESGEWMRAAGCFASMAQIDHGLGATRDAALAVCNRAFALAGGRRWNEAEVAAAACVTERFASANARGRAQALHLRGWVRLQRGELRAGIDDLAGALALHEGVGDGPMSWQVRSLLASAWLLLDEEPRAVAMLRDGLDDFPRSRDLATHARLTHELGRVQRWGRSPLAATTLASARDLYAELGWVRLQQEVACELAVAGWGPAPSACPLGLARGELSSTPAQAMLERALHAGAAADDWPMRLLWLELAIDATRAGADGSRLDQVIEALAERSRQMDQDTELTRRVRAAVQLEIAGAAAALAAHTGRSRLAHTALALARSAGPPLTSARSVLFGNTAFESVNGDPRSATADEADHSQPLPSGIAELVHVRFGRHGYWLLARGSAVHASQAPADAIIGDLVERWRHGAETQADTMHLRTLAAEIAQFLSLDQLLLPQDRILLTRLNGAIADLPWSALPDSGRAANSRLGYAPVGSHLAVIAAVGEVDTRSLQLPARILQMAALDPAELPIELAGSRSESALLQQLGKQYSTPLELLSLAALGRGATPFAPATLVLLSGHAAADRARGENAALRLGADGLGRWGTLDLESWRPPPTILILGACESAAGPQRRYFGDFGLASSAARSGAPWVLGHRWPIDDQAAAEFHRVFVDAVLGGMAPAAAMVRAQRSLAESRRFANPRHWSGALLIHNPAG
jgi:tetratricopeptide (TPR) repeat protein